mgnify:CR=1 FL=1
MLKEIKVAKENIEKAEIAPDEQKQGSYFSWAYSKVSNAARTIKDNIASHTKDLTGSVKVMIENGESIILSHQELADFCATTPCGIITEDLQDIMVAGIAA